MAAASTQNETNHQDATWTLATAEQSVVGRFIPIHEVLRRSFQKAIGQPLSSPKYSAHVPAWCENIGERFCKTIFKPMIALNPQGRFDAENFGLMVGVLLRQVLFIHKESNRFLGSSEEEKLKERLKQTKERELLFRVAGELLHCRIRSSRELKKVGRRAALKQTLICCKALKNVALHLIRQPVEEIQRFLQGVAKGFGLFLDSHGDFTGGRDRINLYFDLLIYWPEISRMQLGEIKRTRRALLDWLEAKSGRRLYDDERTFYDLCDDIGLVMKSPGPPVKSPVT